MSAAVCTLILAFPAAQAEGSGAAGVPPPSTDRRALGPVARVTAPEHCRDARRGLAFYIGVTNEWRSKSGARKAVRPATAPCPRVRYLAKVWRVKARSARLAYLRWWRHEFAWWTWLPAKWYRIARCETGVRWDWDSGTYVSAFGIYRPGYAADAAAVGLPSWDAPGRRTPREQYETALSHYRLHGGYSGWGCRGA